MVDGVTAADRRGEAGARSVLLLGGTGFLGGVIAGALHRRGHRLTLFDRGGRSLPVGLDNGDQVERIRGDRGGDLSELATGRWDVAIDLCGLQPDHLRQTVAVLGDRVDRYVYISSIAAYENLNVPGITESDTLRSLPEDGVSDLSAVADGGLFGALKAQAERILGAAWGDRLLIVRPSLLIGPGDPSDRFSYWVRRLAAGGDVVAPAPPFQPVQFIDVRDLASWIAEAIAQGRSGEFNAACPERQWTLETVLSTIQQVCGGAAVQLHWLAEEFLLEANVEPWIELPLWLPARDRLRGFARMDCRKIERAGLTCRPLAQTVADLLAWDEQFGGPDRHRAGLPRDREAALLAQWRRDWLPHRPSPDPALEPPQSTHSPALEAFDVAL
ncbi:MAG: SDR family oxidoreductase [Cyanophyceae cyanobacterium]